MSAVLRNSTMYASQWVNKYLQKASDYQGRVVPIEFEITVVSPYTTGDTYNCCVLPGGCKVLSLDVTTDGLGASAGSTFTLGDSGAAARYMIATDLHTTSLHGFLAVAGKHYVPSVDTIVVATLAGVITVGKLIKGTFFVSPGA